MNSATKLVVSSKPVELSRDNARQLTGNLPKAITQIKAEAGKDIAIFGSGSLVGQLTDHGLIDEYRLMLNPVILAAGQRCSRMYRSGATLGVLGTREFASGAVLLRYQPGPNS